MEDREMLEKIAQSAQGLDIPEALKPEQIKKRFKKKRSRYRAVAAAACLCLCFGAGSAAYFNEQKQVKYSQTAGISGETDDGAAAQTDLESMPGKETEAPAPVKKLGKMYKLASGYQEVYRVLKKDSQRKRAQMSDGTVERKEIAAVGGTSVADSVDLDATTAQSSSGIKDIAAQKDSADFSNTNLQVEGVDESDCVKTDGKFIYVVQDAQIQVLDVRNRIPEKAGVIQPEMDEDTDRICEIYVADGLLTVIIQTEQTELKQDRQTAEAMKKASYDQVVRYEEDIQQIVTESLTKAVTYNIADPEKPVYQDTVTQDGQFIISRKVGNRLYLFTGQTLHIAEGVQRKEPELWLPRVDEKLVPADCIYLPKAGNQGLLMSSIDLADSMKVRDKKLLINQYAKLYVSSRSVYVYYEEYADDAVKTRIARFALEPGGTIQAKAAKSVKGSIQDTFAIHEREGYLQVLTSVTSTEPWENRVYVLDENMRVAGRLTGLAEGEQIYAARFAGDIGYFVTYRNTDPLFTVDFSDPAQPKVIGELKVTGFSEYLHFWSDDRLLGIGHETDPDSGMTIGIKLSMFDISNPRKVKEEAKLVLNGVSESDALYDYKTVLVSPKKNLIAFTTKKNQELFKEHYRVFSFVDGAFERRVKYTLHSGTDAYPDSRWRSLYVGDMLYLVNERKIYTFAIADGCKNAAKLKFD